MLLINKIKPNFLLIPLFAAIILSAGSYFTKTGLEWYRTINLPEWTPNGAVISTVWTIIFCLTAVSLFFVWNKCRNCREFHLIVSLFIVNAFLNPAFSFLFFGTHQIAIAFFETILLEATIVYLFFLIRRYSLFPAYLLIPYSLWVIFFSFLTYNIWLMN